MLSGGCLGPRYAVQLFLKVLSISLVFSPMNKDKIPDKFYKKKIINKNNINKYMIIFTEYSKYYIKNISCLLCNLNLLKKIPKLVKTQPNLFGFFRTFYIVMEYCEGGDLYTKINRQRGRLLPENIILHYFVQLCKAVQVSKD
jgi:serine/threonine protein kinase